MGHGGGVHTGCNVEHKLCSHDIHAEVNAFSSMVAAGRHRIAALLIIADQEFLPLVVAAWTG